jgi:hypothetical protein
MAHHQGMSLLALANLLRDGCFQRWFHANAVVRATELLLHEKPLSKQSFEALEEPATTKNTDSSNDDERSQTKVA